jgi:hypothetical protein
MTWGRDVGEHDAADQLKVFVEAGGTWSTPRTSTPTAALSTCSPG